MPMPERTLVLAAQLGLLGLLAYAITRAPTALIPLAFALPLLLLGLAARRPDWRKHAMHGVVMISLLGALGGLGMGLRGLVALAQGGGRGLAVAEQLLLGVLCALHVGRCVASFKAARLRQAEAAGQG